MCKLPFCKLFKVLDFKNWLVVVRGGLPFKLYTYKLSCKVICILGIKEANSWPDKPLSFQIYHLSYFIIQYFKFIYLCLFFIFQMISKWVYKHLTIFIKGSKFLDLYISPMHLAIFFSTLRPREGPGVGGSGGSKNIILRG